MATFFVDFDGGNDANDGTTFANRWKTITTGATAIRTSPGDEIRVMASPTPTLVGDVSWTQDSKTVTLPSAVTANITDCETAWTASANVTATASTTVFKENTKACSLVIAAGFTTGKAAYFATGTLDLSAYQQVSFWFRSSVAIPAGRAELRLCSDTTGDTVVHTIAIPAITATAVFSPITVDTGGALNSAIASISLYFNSDPGTPTIFIDNVLACKADSNADALTLTSLLGKVHNLYWEASTAYAANAIRKPTPPNRNGFRYKVTAGGGGNSGGSEPTWPTEIGTTVSDGALTWTCEGVEDTWYPIQSINGTTVKLDNNTATLGSAGRGYPRETETVATYRRETTKLGISSSINFGQFADSGSEDSPLVFTGGWNRTDMTTQTGETWMDNQCGSATPYNLSARAYVHLDNLNATRVGTGLDLQGSGGTLVTNCHITAAAAQGINAGTNRAELLGVSTCMNGAQGIRSNSTGRWTMRRVHASGNLGHGIECLNGSMTRIRGGDWRCENNNSTGVVGIGVAQESPIYGLITRGNVSAGVNVSGADVYLLNASIAEATEITGFAAGAGTMAYSQKHDQTAGNHRIVTDSGLITAATDRRHTASGVSWKFMPTGAIRKSDYPLPLSIAKVAIAANTATAIKIWANRDAADIQGKMIIYGGGAAGVPEDVEVAMEPSVDTWTEYTLNVTPTEDCVLEVWVLVWEGAWNNQNYWIDDFSVT